MGVNDVTLKRINGYLMANMPLANMPRHVSVSGTVSCPINEDYHLDRDAMIACIHEVEPGLNVEWIQQPKKYYSCFLEEKIEINQLLLLMLYMTHFSLTRRYLVLFKYRTDMK